MYASLKTLSRATAYLGCVLLLIACSRSQDIGDPQAFVPEEEPNCPRTEDVTLISSASILANISGGATLASVPIFQADPANPGFDGAFAAGLTTFDPDVFLYYSETERFVNSVRLTALPVIIDSDGDISQLDLTFAKGEEGLDTSPIAATDGVSELVDIQEAGALPLFTDLVVTVVATVRNSLLYLTCVPSDVDRDAFTEITQTYTFRLGYDSETLEFGLLNSNGTDLKDVPIRADEEFGYSVAIYDDTMVVGAPGNDNGSATYQGVNRITFDTDGSITSAGQTLLDELNDDSSLTDSGMVYVFQLDNGVWRIDQLIKPTSPDAGDRFGEHVAIDGDTLVITAPFEDSIASGINGVQTNNVATDSGAVYVYERESAGPEWIERAYIKTPDNVPGVDEFVDSFGASISLDDQTLVIGAPKDDSITDDTTLANVGRAYVYSNDGGSWALQQTLSPSLNQSDVEYGASVALSSSGLLVGSPGDPSDHRGVVTGSQLNGWFLPSENNFDVTSLESGAVYVYELDNNAWELDAYIKSDNSDQGDRFGSELAINETAYFAVSAPFEDGGGTGLNRDMFSDSLENSGAVYSYQITQIGDTGNAYNFQDYIKDPISPAAGGTYGRALASDNQFLVVGAQNSVRSVGVEGAADVYRYNVISDEDFSTLTYVESFSQADDLISAESELNGLSVDTSAGRVVYSAPAGSFDLLDGAGVLLSTESEVGKVGLIQ